MKYILINSFMLVTIVQLFGYPLKAYSQVCFTQTNLYATNEFKRLQSPRYPSQYENNLNCAVNMSGLSGQPIWIKSMLFSLENCCSCDYLSIDGTMYCYPSPIDVVTNISFVHIIFHTDSSVTRSGFILQYTVIPSVCAQQTLYASSEPRRLSSPNYPRPYNNSLLCSVTIYSDSSAPIRIQSFHMELESHATCTYDYLSINGVEYCGRSPIDVVLRMPAVQIIFHTDGSQTFSGFVLQYAVTPTVCFQQQSLNASAEAKLLYSPLYPNAYQNNLNCSVIINSNSGRSIRITSVWMDLEDSSCSYDYLLINNVKYCGATPFDVVLNVSPVLINFHTDVSETFSGFVLRYEEIVTDYLVPFCGTVGTSNISATTEARLLYSPNFPGAYTNSLNCTLNILSGTGQPILVKSLTMETEGSTTCIDYLSVNGVKYCGTSPFNVVLNPPAQIIFHTDSSVTLSGFLLQLVNIAPAFSCKIESLIAEPSKKYFLSSNVSSLPAGIQCYKWHIFTKNGFGAVSLALSRLSLGSSYPCTTSSSSYMAVYDGLYETSPLMSVMCGTTSIAAYNSSYSTMTVVYRTSSPRGDFFNLTFSSIGDTTSVSSCTTSSLTAEASIKEIRPTDFSSSLGFQCFVTNITTKHGFGNVYLTVSDFSVGTIFPCNNGSTFYVTIHDGSLATSPQIATLCGYPSTRRYISSSSSLTLVYYTANPSSNTFTFLYTSVGDLTTATTEASTNPVTTTITTSTTVNPTTILTTTTERTTTDVASICQVHYLIAETSINSIQSSDLRSSDLPNGSQCFEWHILSPRDSERISIHVLNLNLGFQPTCTTSSSSFIVIYDGFSTNSQRTDILCGSQSGGYYQSSSSNFTLVYRTSDRSGESFTFNYSSVKSIYNSSDSTGTKLSEGSLIGIIVGSGVGFMIIVGLLVLAVKSRRKQNLCPPSPASVSTTPLTTTTSNMNTKSSTTTASKDSWHPSRQVPAVNTGSVALSSRNKGLTVNPYTREPSHSSGKASNPTQITSATAGQLQPLSGRSTGAMIETGGVENYQNVNFDHSTENIYETSIDDTCQNSTDDIYVNATLAVYKKPTNAEYVNVAAFRDIKEQ